jgi:hypothetical protein
MSVPTNEEINQLIIQAGFRIMDNKIYKLLFINDGTDYVDVTDEVLKFGELLAKRIALMVIDAGLGKAD